jgi:hypothetical protein
MIMTMQWKKRIRRAVWVMEHEAELMVATQRP